MLLTAFDRRPLGLWPSDRAATPLHRQGPKQLIESAGAQRDPAGEDLADHRAGFVAKADGRP